jgi:branched-chain amino acid transport system permease protein
VTSTSRMRWVVRLAVLALLMAIPFIVNEYRVGLVAQILIFGLAAASLNVLVGVAGLPSLGHAAFFGVGGYAAGLTAIHLTQSVWVCLIMAALVGAALAVPAGLLSVRLGGITFLMLSLAIAEILYSASETWRDVTGGSDGLSGIPSLELFPGFALDLVVERYYFVVVIFAVLYMVLRRFVDSPTGWSLRGVTSNSERMASMGYDVNRYRFVAYVVAGVVGAVAGGLNVEYSRFASPEDLGFALSSLLLVIVILGGRKRLEGAIIAAAIIVYIRQELSSQFNTWEFGLGLILVLVIYFLPGGLSGVRDQVMKALARRRALRVKTTERGTP